MFKVDNKNTSKKKFTMFKVNNNPTRTPSIDVNIVFLLLALDISHTFSLEDLWF